MPRSEPEPAARPLLVGPLMPPLVGTDEEQEALAAYLLSLKQSYVAEASHAN